MWQYIFTSISAVLFFGFVILGVCKFGLLSCYSAYAPKWQSPTVVGLNWWQLVTAWTAILIIPVTVQTAFGNPWQCFSFLAPASLLLVAATPGYQTDKFQNVLHQIGAWGAVVLILAYSFIIPKLLWVFIPLTAIALALGIWKKGTLMFWAEMAMYLGTYVILFVTIK